MHETRDGLVLSRCGFCAREICGHPRLCDWGKVGKHDHKIGPFLDSRTGLLSRDIEKGKARSERLGHDRCGTVGYSTIVVRTRL